MASEVALVDQYDKEGYDFKADIWSLGITAIELACGKSPYMKKDTVEEIVADIPELRGVKFSTYFKDMVSRCLHEDPNERPTAEELLKHRCFKCQAKTASHIVRNVLQKIPPIIRPKSICKFEGRPHKFNGEHYLYSGCVYFGLKNGMV
ncbi:hypothetical protein SUGI_0730350 [Cryptomeria japonica]|nr:hypothetical protein SUGI_0730350 [Cryptomeria japonica]